MEEWKLIGLQTDNSLSNMVNGLQAPLVNWVNENGQKTHVGHH